MIICWHGYQTFLFRRFVVQVCKPCAATLLKMTPMYEWYVASLILKNKHQKICVMIQLEYVFETILASIVNIIGRTCMITYEERRTFTWPLVKCETQLNFKFKTYNDYLYHSQIAHRRRHGASMVKYTSPLPCIGWSASDSKIYTNIEFVKEKIINIWKNTLIYKTKQFMLTKKIQEKSTHFRKRCK